MVDNKTEKKKESKQKSEKLGKPVPACTNCGSKDLGELPKWENVIGSPAMGGGAVCGRCGYRGIPIVFETEDERLQYEQERAEHWKEIKSESAYSPLENLTRKPWMMAVLFLILVMVAPLIILIPVYLSILIFLIRQKKDNNQNISLILWVVLFILMLALPIIMYYFS